MPKEDILIFNPAPRKPPRRRKNPLLDISNKFLEFHSTMRFSKNLNEMSKADEELLERYIKAIDYILKKYE